MYKDRKIHLCSFANLDLYPSALRLKKQAESFNIFDEILIYNEYNLPYNEKFEKLLREKLVPSRGFGYWCWKPFIILKTLESMNDNDILFYTDIGCHLNKEGINRFYEYLDIVIENGTLCFELPYPEKMWTKSDLFNHFNVIDDKNITDSFHRAATSFLLLKNDINLNIINKWLQVYYDDFSLADDTPSNIPNADMFRENRHDQSIFSVLSKMFNFYTISYKEFETNNKNFPINALRDKKDIYNFVDLEACDNFFNKLVLYIPIKKIRDNIRNKFKIYVVSSFIKCFQIYKKNNFIYYQDIINIKILDKCLKYFIDKKIKKYIKMKKIIDYINQ